MLNYVAAYEQQSFMLCSELNYFPLSSLGMNIYGLELSCFVPNSSGMKVRKTIPIEYMQLSYLQDILNFMLYITVLSLVGAMAGLWLVKLC